MKKFISLSLILLSFTARADRLLTIHNRSTHPFWVWLATPPPQQSFAFTFAPAFSSVTINLDAFEYRTIGPISRPCSPLFGPGAIFFTDDTLSLSAPVNYSAIHQITVSHNLKVSVKR